MQTKTTTNIIERKKRYNIESDNSLKKDNIHKWRYYR